MELEEEELREEELEEEGVVKMELRNNKEVVMKAFPTYEKKPVRI